MDTLQYNPWLIVQLGFYPAREREIETILSLGNGYMGSRNSLEEYYYQSNPGSFIAGIYNKAEGSKFNSLIKMPDWTRIFIFIENKVISLDDYDFIEHKRYLDLKNGITVRQWQCIDEEGRITDIKIVKYISFSNKYEFGKKISITPINHSAKIKVQTGIDYNYIENAKNIKYFKDSKSGLISIDFFPDNSKRRIGMSQKSLFKTADEEVKVSKNRGFENYFLNEEFEWQAGVENTYSINSIVSAYTDLDVKCPLTSCRTHLKELTNDFFTHCIDSHINKWNLRWNESYIKITGDNDAQKWVNFGIYHLLTSGEFSGNHYSIPARNLAGEAYKGHVFWDTEMFVLPFFIYTKPEIARKLLLYRYHTLNGARKNAKNESFKGASFAWESTDSGKEMTPKKVVLPDGEVVYIHSGEMENHISPDIAYSVHQYWKATGDDEFIINYGAEIIFETARFCVSLSEKQDDGCYHINHVIGPDEYHDDVDDNAYTNVMAQYNLQIAYLLYDWLNKKNPEALKTLKNKISLRSNEVEAWKEIYTKIYINKNNDGVLEQFKGFFDLKHINLKKYEPRYAPMDVILGREETQKSQVVKQADTLMLMYVLGYKYNLPIIKNNFEYYYPKTSHGSSLSPSIHSILASKIGEADLAYKLFKQNAMIDLDDNMGNASGGIHIASIGGTWLSIVMGFAGMCHCAKGLMFNPKIPKNWKSLVFPLVYLGSSLKITILDNNFEISNKGDNPVYISIGQDNWKKISPHKTYNASKKTKWQWEKNNDKV